MIAKASWKLLVAALLWTLVVSLGVSEEADKSLSNSKSDLERVLGLCPSDALSVTFSQSPVLTSYYSPIDLVETYGKIVWTPESKQAAPVAPIRKQEKRQFLGPMGAPMDIPDLWVPNNDNVAIVDDPYSGKLRYVLETSEPRSVPEIKRATLWSYSSDEKLKSVMRYDGCPITEPKSDYSGLITYSLTAPVVLDLPVRYSHRYLTAEQLNFVLQIKTESGESGLFFVFSKDLAKSFVEDNANWKKEISKRIPNVDQYYRSKFIIIDSRTVFATSSPQLASRFSTRTETAAIKAFSIPPSFKKWFTDDVSLWTYRVKAPECLWLLRPKDNKSPERELVLVTNSDVKTDDVFSVSEWRETLRLAQKHLGWDFSQAINNKEHCIYKVLLPEYQHTLLVPGENPEALGRAMAIQSIFLCVPFPM